MKKMLKIILLIIFFPLNILLKGHNDETKDPKHSFLFGIPKTVKNFFLARFKPNVFETTPHSIDVKKKWLFLKITNAFI